MYDFIPMRFLFDYKNYNGIFSHYYCEAVTEERKEFRVAKAGESDFFLDDYSAGSLIDAMERGGRINGMTLDELRDEYDRDMDEGSVIDISSLL